MSVRGGSHDQTLILLDDAPIYNPAHALSFFSIFNVDAISSVDFYKGNMPVKYGGRLSGVVDIRMKEGNRKIRKKQGAIGVIASKITTEGPLGKDGKLSYMLSGRYSYAGQVVNGIYLLGQQISNDPTANQSTTDNKINFYDLNGKINYRMDDNNHFYLSGYSGSDQFYFNHITNGYNLSWGNRTLSLRWNRVFTKQLFANTTLNSSRYHYAYRILNNTQYFLWRAGLHEQQLKQDYDLYLNDFNHVTFGFAIETMCIAPGEITPRGPEAASSNFSMPNKRTLSTTLYAGNTTRLGSHLQVTYGVRYTAFSLTGTRTQYYFDVLSSDVPADSAITSRITSRGRIEPRASVIFTKEKTTYTLSYDRTTQFLHLLANSSVGLPTDIWWPSSDNIKPQTANIFVIAVANEISKSLNIDVSAFYKTMNNVMDFKDNANLFLNRYLESQLLQGKGTAYGAEVFVAKKLGKFTGSLSYTYSKTFNQIEGVNDGNPYPNRYDKRNNVSTFVSYPLSQRVALTSNFVLTNGGALTMPNGSFAFDGIFFNTYGSRNSYRLPLYNRLDVSLKFENKKKNEFRKVKHYFVLDVYNVYGRKNPFTIYSIQSDYGFNRTETRALFLYRIVPTLTFNFSF